MAVPRDIRKLLPAAQCDYIEKVAHIQCFNPWYFMGLIMPFLLNMMCNLWASASSSLVNGQLLGYIVACNATALLLVETGSNKSGAFNFLAHHARQFFVMLGINFRPATPQARYPLARSSLPPPRASLRCGPASASS